MSKHTDPIVPSVLYVAEQHHPWKLAPIERLKTRYHTPTTVALAFGTVDATVKPQKGKSGVTKQQYHVWCVPDDAAWSKIEACRADLQKSLDLFAGYLRLLGSYAKRLDEAGGIKKAPNPLSPTVIRIDDPDNTTTCYFVQAGIPRIYREEIASHTPKMLNVTKDGRPWSTSHQRDHFVCPADDHWNMIESRRADAQRAYDAWQALLKELGTYQDALGDGRYAGLPARAVVAAAQQAPARFPELNGAWFYAHHRNESRNVLMHIWRSEPSKSAKVRFVSACGMAMQHEEPRRVADLAKPALELCAQCRRLFEEKQEVRAVTIATPTPALRSTRTVGDTDLSQSVFLQLRPAGFTWEHAKQTPDGHWHHVISTHNHALLRNDQVMMRLERLEALLTPKALTVAEAPIVGVAMMDKAEARETLDAMREDLGQIDLSVSGFRGRALEFADRQGWRALGYSSSAEAINAELGTQYTKSYLSRLLKAAEVERFLELSADNSVPTKPLRELAESKLDTPEQQREAWDRATTLAGGATPTSAHVRQAVQEIKPARPNAPEGWVWRDNGSLRRIADGYIEKPWAHPAATVAAAERHDRERTLGDAQHIAAARKLLATLDQWGDAQRAVAIQEAYSHARQIRDTPHYQAMMAEVDAAVEGQAPTQPTVQPTPITPLSRDADGPWFWASKSAVHPTAHCWHRSSLTGGYVSACGIEASVQPTSGAKGFHCGVCEKNADRREIIPIPSSESLIVATGRGPVIVPRRPRQPASADISAHLAYAEDMERYADQLEQRIAELEQQLQSGEYGPVATLESEVGI